MRAATAIGSLALLVASLLEAAGPAGLTLREGTRIAVSADHSGDRLATDVAGRIWLLDGNGGRGRAISAGDHLSSRPALDPGGSRIAYEYFQSGRHQIAVHDIGTGQTSQLTFGDYDHHAPAWHPDGRRLALAADRGGDFGIWEVDLDTLGLQQLTISPGDERDPAWNREGDRLAYIGRAPDGGDGLFVLEPDGRRRLVLAEPGRLHAPSWRPGDALIAYVNRQNGRSELRVAILSEPAVSKPLTRGENVFPRPPVWLDRTTLLYTADGHIKRRDINRFSSVELPFELRVELPQNPVMEPAVAVPDDTAGTARGERLVIRVGRLFDGLGPGYRDAQDIVIDGDMIVAVQPWRDPPPAGRFVDARALTALPGLIDMAAGRAGSGDPGSDRSWLAAGVTSIRQFGIVTAESPGAWPGPRRFLVASLCRPGDVDDTAWPATTAAVMTCDFTPGMNQRAQIARAHSLGLPAISATPFPALLLGIDEIALDGRLPGQDAYNRRSNSADSFVYGDVVELAGAGGLTVVSRLGGLPDDARAAAGQSLFRAVGRGARIVVGSDDNRLPPGAGVHRELRALAETGLQPFQVLRMASRDAARAIGAGDRLGEIREGRIADLVMVDGDPLAAVADARHVTMVVVGGQLLTAADLRPDTDVGKFYTQAGAEIGKSNH